MQRQRQMEEEEDRTVNPAQETVSSTERLRKCEEYYRNSVE
jgi:hypothetical protein